MIYKAYGSPENNSGNTHMYSMYAPPNAYVQGQGGSRTMYGYAGTGGHGSGHPFGYHANPSMGVTYEYNGGINVHHNGSAYRVGGGTNGRDRGGDVVSLRNLHGYDQQATSDYEVHDNQLKAPVVVTPATVVSTLGSARLFSKPPKPIVYGSRCVVRICDAFQEGRCAAGDRCHDIHVRPEYLAETRMEMSSWLFDRECEFRQTMEMDSEKTFSIFVADLKEVVEVPINSLVFTKGLYVDPATRAKRARGAGNHAHVHAMMQVPTSCGLYSTDPLQCKWERWCNQVHIDHRWMQVKKAEFDQWFIELQNRYFSLAPDDTFTVHDPQLKSSISLPKFSIAGFSRGLFQGSMKKLASVCLLFQRGKCTAGSCCNQIHVFPQYLSLAREFAAMEQSPDALPEEKQRLRREMELLRGPLMKQEKQETAAMESASLPNVVSSANEGTHSDAMDIKAAAEEDLASCGALFEHVQVDEDVEPVSHLVSANTSLTRRMNASAPDISLSVARHMNSDGSYSFNPYGSVTSLPDGSTSFNRFPGTRGSGQPMDGNGSVQYTPGSVQLLSTDTKGMRRLVALVSPESGNGAVELHRNGDDMGIGGNAGDGGTATVAHDRAPPFAAGHRSNGGYRAVAHPLGDEGGRYDSGTQGEQSCSLHPLDFDASWHFSPTPLLGFDASTTSTHRNGSIRDEDPAMHAHLRLTASNSSYIYPGSSTTSQQNLLSTPMHRGVTSNATTAARVRLAASAASSRTHAHRSATSLPDSSTTNPAMGGSVSSMPTARPTFVGEQLTGTR
ncbi:conserved hypothetical protein [Leishmania major strain Friedlin]|uniref:C3H1-type domain-containing protein n=1 Tax=Leishmania major TaxID=5664 RepID=Q4Q1Z2_LEIMA|nr:conserved hypothetical protein [Leishmania major strain Friedlin]CAG9583602.1 zinc_finger_protein_family_member_-_putative [Leishmania major strain Friedlin]CAJ09037.1 conserved hypothetical protein [Leishmania major strain Friedlin]|eukprot:XP_001686656.1 conserved hypothetical protein [Leishmania major strain Friedlin]